MISDTPTTGDLEQSEMPSDGFIFANFCAITKIALQAFATFWIGQVSSAFAS